MIEAPMPWYWRAAWAVANAVFALVYRLMRRASRE